MPRTEQAQGLRLMKFEEGYGRAVRGVPGQAEARGRDLAGRGRLQRSHPGGLGISSWR